MDFIFGCNYWASNAGTEMWREFDEKIIKKDLEILKEHGITHLRVFPNWRDFQPAVRLYGYQGIEREVRHIDGSVFTNEYYLDEVMLERFKIFCTICEDYGFKLIVALVTGWMSGRLFVPPILEGRNLYSDPLAVRLEQKFLKGFVGKFKTYDCIIAWGIGNECNCLSEAERDTAAAWTGNIVNAIKACDSKRPVISDMHGLGVDNAWRIKDQAECCDILTTHPYPHFVPHCFKDGMNSFRTLMHVPCENKYYSEIGGKPCFTEEIGILGPMTCDEETAVAFLKSSAYQAFINGQPGFMWWCAYEQSHLETAPYSWIMMERELGLIDRDGKPKKILKAMKEVSEKLKLFAHELTLPETDIVCITTKGQDNWGISYMSYCLSRQVGLNVKFAYSEYEIPKADVYMLPSISGDEVMPKEKYFELKQRVYDGATLYISNNDGYLTEFSEFCGLEVCDSKVVSDTCEVVINNNLFKLERTRRRILKECGAEIIGYDNLGNPAFSVHSYGNGKVYYLNFPLEESLLQKENAFFENYCELYKIIFKDTLENKPLKCDNENILITYHNDKAVLFNCSDKLQKAKLINSEEKLICEVVCEPYDFCIKDV